METSILLSLLCSLLLLLTRCSSAKCSAAHLSPEIRFPFRIEPESDLPHFYLFCKHNTTLMIHFPSYGDLAVKSISYATTYERILSYLKLRNYEVSNRLNLIDPRNCVHEVFLNLNLSLTPFTYYYHVQRYTYISCSTKLDANSFQRVPCLSTGYNHHVYIVRPSFPTPVSCTPVKTVEIPFAYSPYISDSSFGLALTWSSTQHDLKKYLRVVNAVTGIIASAFMVGKLLYSSLLKYRQQLKVKKTLGEFELQKFLLEI